MLPEHSIRSIKHSRTKGAILSGSNSRCVHLRHTDVAKFSIFSPITYYNISNRPGKSSAASCERRRSSHMAITQLPKPSADKKCFEKSTNFKAPGREFRQRAAVKLFPGLIRKSIDFRRNRQK